MTNFIPPRLLKSAVAAGALLSLGGCMYGGGVYGDGYVNNRGYDCDPYAPFDDYYACDYGYGFANIGFGGGWYDQYYYPGYGIYIFDRGGKRHAMRNNHRRHWARQRAEYGGHRARDRRDRRDQRYDRRDRSRDPNRDHVRGQRRSDDRNNRGARDERGNRPETRATRPDRTAPTRNRGDRAGRPDRRPTRAVEQPQSRPQPAARTDRASRPPRPQPARNSRETNRNGRKPLNDD